jgi:hypothetical protein
MAKIEFDKYYTPPIVAKWCIEKAYEIIGKDNITEIVEPAAGAGSFSHQIPNCIAMDLYPQHEYIHRADFVTESLGYKRGRLFIGNPPFGGSTGKLLLQFYDKCVSEGDYIAWILPAKYYKNYERFHKFEIIYSVLLDTKYTNLDIPTSFVIYKRNPDKDNFSNPKYKTDKIKFTKYDRKLTKENKQAQNHDFTFVIWGQLFKESKPYKGVATMAIDILDEKWKTKIINYFKWLYKYNKETNCVNQFSISSPSIELHQIKQLLYIAYPELFEEIIEE